MNILTLYATMQTPLGKIGMTSEKGALTGLYTPKNTGYMKTHQGIHDPKSFDHIFKQLDEYFAGKRRHFDLPLAPLGTVFQKRVWQALCEIPYGETTSYGDIAKKVGCPGAARAVGKANGQNPLAIIIPCHRVIGANGTLVGYNGGLEIKKWLLEHEAKGRE